MAFIYVITNDVNGKQYDCSMGDNRLMHFTVGGIQINQSQDLYGGKFLNVLKFSQA